MCVYKPGKILYSNQNSLKIVKKKLSLQTEKVNTNAFFYLPTYNYGL